MTKTLAPFVYWAQTESEVLMRVDLKDVQEPSITLGRGHIRHTQVNRTVVNQNNCCII